MIRLSDALTAIFSENPLLQCGFGNRLFNLSQLSDYLRPLVEARAKKSVTKSAVTMALSRMQREWSKKTPKRSTFSIEHISIQTGLLTYTFPKTTDVHRGVHRLFTEMQKKDGYMTFSESTHQITVIIAAQYRELVKQHISNRPMFHHQNVSSVGIMFDPKFIKVPGLIYIILQQTTLQGINIIEISSTYTELILYIDEKDTKVAFETLYGLFGSS